MDVIELGRPDRAPRPSRPPRRGWPFGVAALVALAAVAYTGTRPEQPTRPVASPSPSPSWPQPVVVSTPPDEPPQPTSPEFAGEWQVTARRERTGLELALASGASVTIVDADTGRSRPLHVPGDPGYALVVTQIEGGWLVGSFPFCEEGCNGEFYAVRGDDTQLVGKGTNAFVDPDGRSVWVEGMVEQRYDSPNYLEHRTWKGARIGSQMRLREGEGVAGITPSGPLLETGFLGGNSLLDFATRRRTRVLTGRFPVGVAGYEVATTSESCYGPAHEDCTLRVTNLRTGRTRHVATLDGRLGTATMDPTAHYVAVTLDKDLQAVRVYDVAARREVAIRGVGSPPMAASVRWSPDGKWLVLAHPAADDAGNLSEESRIAVWRPGLDRLFSLEDLAGNAVFDVVLGVAR